MNQGAFVPWLRSLPRKVSQLFRPVVALAGPTNGNTTHGYIKNRGIEIYTLTAGTNNIDFYADMVNWSSGGVNEWGAVYTGTMRDANIAFGGVNGDNGIDYAGFSRIDGTISTMYDNVVDSLSQITLSVIYGNNLFSESVQQGLNVPISLPEGFRCLPDREQELPIRLNFRGTGVVELSNARLNMCQP